MMAYVTVEDDTAAIEMLAFSKVLSEFGGYLRENQPVVITGKVSLRDDKEPQILINRARPMSDFTNPDPFMPKEPRKLEGTLYLRLDTEDEKIFGKVRAMINMFPGEQPVVVYFADTKVRRGARCGFAEPLLQELTQLLGEENVVLK